MCHAFPDGFSVFRQCGLYITPSTFPNGSTTAAGTKPSSPHGVIGWYSRVLDQELKQRCGFGPQRCVSELSTVRTIVNQR